MGLGIFKPSSCSCGEGKSFLGSVVDKIFNKQLPVPRAGNFEVLKIEQHDNMIIALVIYPDCTNYEGHKILVFENASLDEIKFAKILDPHFCTASHLSPIARFEPTDYGWKLAECFVKNWTQER